jgi:hypothetical protein
MYEEFAPAAGVKAGKEHKAFRGTVANDLADCCDFAGIAARANFVSTRMESAACRMLE